MYSLLLGRVVALERKRSIVIEHSPNRLLVSVFVCLSVCLSSALWQNGYGCGGGRSDHRMGPGMRQVVGFGNWSAEGSNFRGECGAPHCNQWGVCGVAVQTSGCEWICHHGWRRGLFLNYFGQSCYYY